MRGNGSEARLMRRCENQPAWRPRGSKGQGHGTFRLGATERIKPLALRRQVVHMQWPQLRPWGRYMYSWAPQGGDERERCGSVIGEGACHPYQADGAGK